MKKLSLLVLICMLSVLILGVMTSCSEHTHTDADNNEICDVCESALEHKNHTNGTTWAFDATNHYHMCTKCAAKADVAAHIDEDGDNACDVCLLTMANLFVRHEHDYEDTWSFDAENHFKACNTCIEVKDSAPHADEDDDNACDTCGYIFTNYFVPRYSAETIEEIIDAAVANMNKVNGSTIYLAHGDGSKYETTEAIFTKGANFADCFVTEVRFNAYGQSYTTVVKTTYNGDGAGSISAALKREGTADSNPVVILTGQNAGWLAGYGFDRIYGTSGDPVYAIEAVVVDLFATAISTETFVGNVIEMGDTVYYGFSLQHTIGTYLYDVAVSFTINDDGIMESIAVSTAETYLDGEGDPLYGIPAFVYNYAVVQTTGELATTPTFAAADYLIGSFTLKDKDEAEINTTDGFEVTLAESTVLTIDAITPDNAIFEDNFNTKITTADGDSTSSAFASFNNDTKTISVTSYKAGDFKLAVYINGDEENAYMTIPFTAVYAPTTEIGVAVNGSEDTVTAATTFANEQLSIAGIAGNYQDASITAELKGINATDASLTKENDGTYTFTSNVVGTYTVEIKSVANDTLSAVVLTIIVADPFNIEEALATDGKFLYDLGYGDYIELVFDSDAGTMVCTYVWYGNPYVTNYTYSVEESNIVLTVTGTHAAYYVDDLTFEGTLTANGYNNGTKCESGASFTFVEPTLEEILARDGKFTYDLGYGDYIELVFDSDAGTMVCTYVWYGNPYVTNYTYSVEESNIVLTVTGTHAAYYVDDLTFEGTLTANGYNNGTKCESGASFTFVTDSASSEPVTATPIQGGADINSATDIPGAGTYSVTVGAGETVYFSESWVDTNYYITIEITGDVTAKTGTAMFSMPLQSGGTFEIDEQFSPVVCFWFVNNSDAPVEVVFTLTYEAI